MTMARPRARSVTFIFAAALLLLFSARAVRASDPSLARYTDDPSRVFWFVWITDTHIDNPLYSGEEDKLTWALTTGVDVVDPYFVVNSGDLTDSTGDIIPYYGYGPHPEEWDKYRDIVDGAGMTADFYYDVIGNHDAYGDTGASYYLSRSVQGSAQHTTQPDWRLDLPFGSYHFVTVATTCNDWAQWPFDRMEITDAEYNELLDNLSSNTDTHLTIGVGHHDFLRSAAGVDVIGGTRVAELFSTFAVPYYMHGHEHDFRARVTDGGVVIQRVSSLGQTNADNFCVQAVDADALSLACTSATSAWPLAVVTAPVDVKLDNDNDVDNPYAPSVPTTCTEAPVRALAFDVTPVSVVSFWWDTGTVGAMTQSATIPKQWTGTFDATSFSPGIHTLTVEVIGSETRDFEIQVLFENRTCDLSNEPADEEMEEAAEIIEETVSETVEAPEEAADVPPDAAMDMAVDGMDDSAADADEAEGEIIESGCGCRTVL